MLKPYAEPYDWDAIIADLRSVGEKQYGMVWEESLWVKNRGQDYGSKYDDEWGYEMVDGHYHGNCQFYFPESTRDTNNAKDFRDDCLYTFENMVVVSITDVPINFEEVSLSLQLAADDESSNKIVHFLFQY